MVQEVELQEGFLEFLNKVCRNLMQNGIKVKPQTPEFGTPDKNETIKEYSCIVGTAEFGNFKGR